MEDTITSFKFDELSDEAKEVAREWWRECENYDDWSCTYEDAAKIGELMGINMRQKPVKLMNGSTRYDPCIWFSGFSSQGDGACFEGSYSYAKNSRKAVREHAPQDTKLHDIVDSLFDAQRRNFYRLEVTVAHRGYYYHSGCTDIDVFDRENNYRDIGAAEDQVKDALRGFMDWIYDQLRAEYEFTMSDENVDESIRINEYDFDEDGKLT